MSTPGDSSGYGTGSGYGSGNGSGSDSTESMTALLSAVSTMGSGTVSQPKVMERLMSPNLDGLVERLDRCTSSDLCRPSNTTWALPLKYKYVRIRNLCPDMVSSRVGSVVLSVLIQDK
ncbi:unnamed protein product [Camellia sinensis]